MNKIENESKNGNEIDKKNEMNEYAKWKLGNQVLSSL